MSERGTSTVKLSNIKLFVIDCGIKDLNCKQHIEKLHLRDKIKQMNVPSRSSLLITQMCPELEKSFIK